MLHSLREDLATSHVFDLQRQAFPVLDLLPVNGLEAGLLELAVTSPDNLAARVHGHGRLLAANLHQNGSLVIAQGDVVRTTENP